MVIGNKIGEGRTAEVYECGEEKILKLYFSWYNNEWIKYEEEIGLNLVEQGVSCPKIYGMVKQEERMGIIYEKINGISMLRLIEAKPWRARYFGRKMAGIHYDMHSFHCNKLPEQKAHIEYAIRASSELLGEKTEKIVNYLKSLSDDTSVCHGDFHPDNILQTDEKAVVIDWTNTYYGNPLGDVARTVLMLKSTYLPPDVSKVMVIASKIIRSLICSGYIKEYTKKAGIEYKAVEDWMLPIAAARLRENVTGEKQWLLDIINKKISELHL